MNPQLVPPRLSTVPGRAAVAGPDLRTVLDLAKQLKDISDSILPRNIL